MSASERNVGGDGCASYVASFGRMVGALLFVLLAAVSASFAQTVSCTFHSMVARVRLEGGFVLVCPCIMCVYSSLSIMRTLSKPMET